MAYQPDDNAGVLFLNDRKEKPQHPDMRGTLVINGKEYWLSAWKKSSKAGTKYMSLSVREKAAREETPPPAAPAPPSAPDELPFNDDIPF